MRARMDMVLTTTSRTTVWLGRLASPVVHLPRHLLLNLLLSRRQFRLPALLLGRLQYMSLSTCCRRLITWP
jgi:hypothetical protein